jgi:hypothetical protein
MRHVEVERIEEREEARAHRRCRNRPGELAVLRSSVNEFRRSEDSFAREKKRGKGGAPRLFIAGFYLAGGARVRSLDEIERRSGAGSSGSPAQGRRGN